MYIIARHQDPVIVSLHMEGNVYSYSCIKCYAVDSPPTGMSDQHGYVQEVHKIYETRVTLAWNKNHQAYAERSRVSAWHAELIS